VFAAALGLVFTLAGVRCALRGDLASHGRWMLRSYGVVATLLTLYAIFFVLVALGVRAGTAYDAAHIYCLPVNLALVEGVLARQRYAGRSNAVR
jgi:hypothetical protein